MFDRLHPRSVPAAVASVAALAILATAATAAGASPHAKARATRTAPAVKSVPVAAAPAAVTPQPAAVPAPAPAGLMAFIDPATGLLTGPISSLVPPADQRAAAASVLLEPVQLPNGAWMLDLKGTGMESYVMHIDAFGQRTVTCVQDARVPAVIATPAPPTARKER